MDINTLIARLVPRLWLIIALALLGGVAAFTLSRFSTPAFRSEARILVGQTLDSRQVDYTDLLASQFLAQTYADLVKTTPILSEAGDALTPPLDVAAISASISARAPAGSVYVVIEAQAAEGPRAAAIANAIASSLVSRAPATSATDDELQAAIAQDLRAVDGQVAAALDEIGRLSGLVSPTPEDTGRLEVLQARLETLRAQRATLAGGIRGPGSNVLTIVEPASTPTEAFQPRTIVNGALGALIGAALAVGFALYRARPGR